LTSPTSATSNGGTVPQSLLDTLNGTASSSSPSSPSSSSSSTDPSNLQTTFLTLLVAQLKNQDPTNPTDSAQLTSQLAQINTVTGINQLNTSLSSLATQLQAGQRPQAALLIGSSVLVPGSTAFVSNGKSAGFGVSLPSDATDVQVTIKDAGGNVISTLDLGAHSAGTVPVVWTPTDASGNALPDGAYTVSAVATSAGQTSTVPTLSGEQVLSVIEESSGGTGLLLQDGTTVDQTQVAAIL
jgi:flagellar basal-body rod modification protein FlgD